MLHQETKTPITPASEGRAFNRIHKLMNTLTNTPEPFRMFRRAEVCPAKAETVQPKAWPHLPTLSSFLLLLNSQFVTKNYFAKTLLLSAQHHLGTTADLYEFFQKLGLEHIVTVGKDYSTHCPTVKKMEERKITCIDHPPQSSFEDFDAAYRNGCFEARRVADEKIAKSNGAIQYKICLDDGGQLINGTTKGQRLVAVEQTTSGWKAAQTTKYPVIGVATSYVKTAIEPQLVAETTVEQLDARLKKTAEAIPYFRRPETLRIGIVGLGNIGFALLEALIKKGKRKFILHEADPVQFQKQKNRIKEKYGSIRDLHLSTANDINIVLGHADIILGCTGVDITKDKTDVFNSIDSPKILASCSSRAIEFHTILELKAKDDPVRDEEALDPLKDIRFKNGWGAELIIWQLGKPITFDQTEHALPPKHADLVRTLLAIGVIQAKFMQNLMIAGVHVEATSYKLSPTLVQYFTQTWLNHLTPLERKFMEIPMDISNLESISQRSGGKLFEPFEIEARQWIKNMEIMQSLSEPSRLISRL